MGHVHRRLVTLTTNQQREQPRFGTHIGRWYDECVHLYCDEIMIVVIVTGGDATKNGL
jgi:hypothetical protein